MSHYFVNNHARSDGNHLVHALGCKQMPPDKRYLGNFMSADEAMIEARKDFWKPSGCERCAREYSGTYHALRTADDTLPSNAIR